MGVDDPFGEEVAGLQLIGAVERRIGAGQVKIGRQNFQAQIAVIAPSQRRIGVNYHVHGHQRQVAAIEEVAGAAPPVFKRAAKVGSELLIYGAKINAHAGAVESHVFAPE